MSFDYNPYRHVELVQSDVNPGQWFWHCHGCGADAGRAGELPLTYADMIVRDFYNHLRNSHAREPEDFYGWSKW